MTQQDKQLLLKDICERLPYGVIYHRNDGANIELREADIKIGNLNYTDNIVVRECKPYLRPMSSITNEEFYEYMRFIRHSWEGIDKEEDDYYIKVKDRDVYIDWLLAHHFDFRDLISKGLALEAPYDMYKTE